VVPGEWDALDDTQLPGRPPVLFSGHPRRQCGEALASRQPQQGREQREDKENS
jgi:hypothetical protein